MFGIFGVGPIELLVVGCVALVPVLIICAVVLLVRNSGKAKQIPNERLGTCPDCGRQVSLLALSCPGCGRPFTPTA